MKGKYSINFKKFGAWIAVIAIIAAGAIYLINSGQETTSLSIEVEEELESGELTTVRATMDDSPVSGAQVYLNNENVGATNQEGRLTVPITQESGEANIRVETAEESTETTSTVVENTSSSDDSDSDSGDDDSSDDSSNSDDSDGSDSDSGDDDSGDDSDSDTSGSDSSDNDSSDSDGSDSSDSDGSDSTDDTSDGSDSDNQDSTDDSTDDSNDNTDDSTDDSGDVSVVDAYFSYSGEEQVNQNLNFDATESQGENLEYSWDFGNGETSTNSQPTHSYSSSGTYSVTLTVTNGNGDTDTTSTNINIESAPTPNFVFYSPENGDEYDDTTIEYDIRIGNAVNGAEYRVIANQDTLHSGTLDEGGNSLTRSLAVPSGTFDTWIEVDQGGQTHTSQKQTITAGTTQQDPEITLDSPTSDTSTIEDTQNIEFQFTTGETSWADNLELQVLDTDGNTVETSERPASINDTFNIEKELNSGETYNWQVEATNSEGQSYTTSQETFEITQEQPDASITHNSPSDGATVNDYQVTFDYTISSEVSATYTAEIVADEDMSRTWMQCDGSGSLQEETISYDEGETVTTFELSIAEGRTIESAFDKVFNIAGSYRWTGETKSDGKNSLLTSSGPQTFTTTDQTPEDSPEDCGTA